MRGLLLCVSVALFATRALAANDGESVLVTGQGGVGTLSPRARLGVLASPRDKGVFSVSNAAGKRVLFVGLDGRTGIGARSPLARLDVAGPADFGLMNLFSLGPDEGGRGPSLAFASADASSRFEMRAHHSADGSVGDSFEIEYRPKMFNMGATLPLALTIGGGASPRACAVQTRPGGPAVYELEVSAGGARAGDGVIRYAESGEHASRFGRTVLSRLGRDAELQAYKEVSAMKHSQYRFVGMATKVQTVHPVMRGIRYEDAPESIRAPDRSLVLDERIMNLELALKEADRRIRELSALVEAAESK